MRKSKREPNKQRLTELFVQKPPVRKSAYVVWDTKQSGLGLRVQPTGSSSWSWSTPSTASPAG